jgi:hypothetical protein
VPPFSCGDANADGALDLSDSVYVLNYLFQGGPPPCRVGNPVLQTSQMLCFNNTAPIACPAQGTSFFGQDAVYQAGLEREFQDNGLTVTDRTTGLIWLRAPLNNNFTWTGALDFANNFTVGAGLDDWRLPNILESMSICDYGRFSPSLDPVFDFGLIDAGNQRFWTSSTTMVQLNMKWRLNYEEGHVADNLFTDSTRKAWPVRLGLAADIPVGGVPAATPPFDCGDANGDGDLNLSDAVYILNHLNVGGPAPCVVANPVLKTGIQFCYDPASAFQPVRVLCNLPEVSGGGQDGFHQAGLPRDFEDNGDGTVLDLTTGLTWLATPEAIVIEALGGGDGRLFWADALAFCEGFIFGGHSDWRLPNVNELATMVNYGRENGPDDFPARVYAPFFTLPGQIAGCFVERIPPIPFWTSTTSTRPAVGQQNGRNQAFAIDFFTGRFHNDTICTNDKDTRRFFVWPVRGGIE